MTKTVEIILLALALICFLLAAFTSASTVTTSLRSRVNLIALGLAFWVLVPLGTLVLG